MERLFYFLIILCFIFPTTIHADQNRSSVKIAFTRDGFVWIKDYDKEEKITEKKATYNFPPSWSFDETMLLY
ncbi:hypothetical protein [Psychrobacillus sp. L4]|uniref:hypothetical protein n=1 Tax=Psychrobacillus sp. L4 TaxID=3236892 RepID=UPI0036F2A427